MRVNVYAEEMTDRVELITKTIEGQEFHAVRLYLELPVTIREQNSDKGIKGQQVRGPFMHHPGDDDSAAITFWGKRDLRPVLLKMLSLLDDWNESKGRERVHSRDWTELILNKYNSTG